MKMPEVGELWSDEVAWATTGRPRLLLVTEVEGDVVRGKPVMGDGSGQAGISLADFARTWTWQGYWSLKHQTLNRLSPPYDGHGLADIPKSRDAARLHGTADLIMAIVPSLAPVSVYAFNRERRPVTGAALEKPVSSIPPGVMYLQLGFEPPRLLSRGTMADRPASLLELWYQKQANAWWLGRVL